MEWLPVFAYVLVLGTLTALGAPIAATFFRTLPRKGAAFALPAALVPFTVAVFWLGQLAFGRHTLAVGVAVVLVGAILAVRYGTAPEWRSVAVMYGVFVVGFFVMLALRATDPSITPPGGEQFLHFGILNAIERADSLPPEDMWFAGRPLKYYYGTQLQVAALSMLSGTPLRYGFNLGIATFYGLVFVAAYGLCGAVLARRGRSYHFGGVFGAFFVAVAGPATTAIRLATPFVPEVFAGPLERAAFGFAAGRFYGGDLERAVGELSGAFDWTWWYTRYVVPGTLHEVPLYSFVKADLHGHAFANPYLLVAGALGFAYYTAPGHERGHRRLIVFGGLGGVAGLFGFMNTWSFPTVAGLAFLAVAAADPHPATLLPEPLATRLEPSGTPESGDPIARAARELHRSVAATLLGGAVLLVGILVAAPFLLFGDVPTNDGIGFLPPRSPLDTFLVVYVALLTLFALYVVVCGRPVIGDVPRRWLVGGSLTLGAAMATALLFQSGVLALLGVLVVSGWVLLRSDRAGFEAVLLIAGAGLLVSLELVHARLPLIDQPRWNTSLKVAVQAWTLTGAGAGAATALLLARYRERVASVPSLPSVVAVGLVVSVLLASAVFPVMVFGSEVGSEVVEGHYEPSIDGLREIEREHHDEYHALRWLKNRPGTPTLVEAPGRPYQWTSPAGTFSGLPGVIGWDHEAEYRSPEAYDRRVQRVDEIYAGNWSDAAGHLARYDVTYVYVGPNERDRYGNRLRPFDREAFSVAYERGAVTIYEVDPAALPAPEAGADRNP